MPRVVHFEIPAGDPERAAAFLHKGVLGWKVEKWPGPMDYWMVDHGSPMARLGINGGFNEERKTSLPLQTLLAWKSIEKAVAAVSSAGGKEIMPKTPIPTVWLFRVLPGTRKETCSD